MHVLPWSLHVLDSMQFSPSAAGESKWQSQTCSPALWTHASFSHFLSLRQVLLQLAQCSFFLKQRLSGLEQHLDSKQSSPSATHHDELFPMMLLVTPNTASERFDNATPATAKTATPRTAATLARARPPPLRSDAKRVSLSEE